MTQKHHQKEISGPLDTVKAVPVASDLPRPKRARIQIRKALENRLLPSLPPRQPPNPSPSPFQGRDRALSKQAKKELIKKRRKTGKYNLNQLETSLKSYEFFASILALLKHILRNRTFRTPQLTSNNLNSRAKSVRKGVSEGHSWSKLNSYRVCQICSSKGPPDRPCTALQKTSGNVLNRDRVGQRNFHRTI